MNVHFSILCVLGENSIVRMYCIYTATNPLCIQYIEPCVDIMFVLFCV